jgi:predicted nucleic-acid-binding protein
MIGLDTNVLARYYVDDVADAEAARQRLVARELIESDRSLAVGKTVVLELECVLRGFYGFSPLQVDTVLRHLLALPNCSVEDRAHVEFALDAMQRGLDFADALHLAGYSGCKVVASFDAKGFARCAARLSLSPLVVRPDLALVRGGAK